MRSKYFALMSYMLFICSHAYFLYINKTVYEPESEVDYFFDIFPSLVTPIILSIVLSFLIWLFKRNSYENIMFWSLFSICTIGIGANLLATYLMFWSASQ
jgi:hypothetical protein